MLYQIIETTYANAAYNAGSKARSDTVKVLSELGFIPVEMTPHNEERATAGKVGKLLGHMKAALDWRKTLKGMGRGDVVLLQLPLINHTIYINKAFESAVKRGLKVIALIHDLEELRCALGSGSLAEKTRYSREGRLQRQLADIIIAHNEAMKKYLTEELGVPEQQVVVLGIFDYLLDKDSPMADCNEEGVVIAGNLSPEKTGYIYKLPENVKFSLYGKGLDEERLAGKGGPGNNEIPRTYGNITYRGVFSPDTPGAIKGSFGLVWDGASESTCEGVYGAYIKYNAPHKTSLYLSCGMPVIIWKQAGLAPLIEQRKLGLTVNSLSEVAGAIDSLTPEDYRKMRENASVFAAALRRGHMLQEAISEALDRLGDIFNN